MTTDPYQIARKLEARGRIRQMSMRKGPDYDTCEIIGARLIRGYADALPTPNALSQAVSMFNASERKNTELVRRLKLLSAFIAIYMLLTIWVLSYMIG